MRWTLPLRHSLLLPHRKILDGVSKKSEETNQLLADLMEWPPSDVRVQKAIALHHQHLNF